MKKQLLIIFLLLIAKIIFAQSGTVTGTLSDADGNALPGVTIMIKGTTFGTLTDLDGNYSIECNIGETLVISFIGMKTQERVVTADMFQSTNPNSIKRYKPVQQKPVENIQNRAYSELLRTNRIQQEGYFDMYSAPLTWCLPNLRNKNSYFFENQYRNIIESDSNFVFIPMPTPMFWEVEYSSTISSKKLMNLPKLQSTYAQGRPNLGKNTWFGAETNEQFAFGPKIENLVFDGSNYAYDSLGQLITQNTQNQTSAKAYNPYNLLQKSIVLNNSVNLTAKKNEAIIKLIYFNRKESGFLESTNLLANNLMFNFENRKKALNYKLRINYNTTSNNFINTNALWTKTLAAIMLTPPTFDNSQGTIQADGNQRSSAINSNNNPYFLLSAKENSLENNYFKTNLELNYTKFYLNFKIISKYDKNKNIENFYMPKKTVGFSNSYHQKEKEESEEFYLKLDINSDKTKSFSFASMPVYTFEKIQFLRKVNDLNDFNYQTQRKTLNWTQNINYNPNFIRGINLNLKNTSYLNQTNQKWLLPSFSIAYDFARIINNYTINKLKFYGNFTSAINEMPLYLRDKSYTTLTLLPEQLNSFLENQELFYNENLNLETRKCVSFGLNSFFFRSKLFFDFDYENTLSENSIFPILNSETFELQNIASIRNQTFEFSVEYYFRYYYHNNLGWKTSLRFSSQKPVVEELYGNNTQIAIAGFQSVSKNLIKDEPVGIIVGSAYLRNEKGQMIIGNDGFPLVDTQKQIIGNPNPDFKLYFENYFRFFHIINLNLLLEYQHGGDIWNGTKNTLDYFGLSESSAQDRNTTNYIFEGVNQAGEINNIPVDFANPNNNLEGNRWYRYGENGVAEEAIEEGSFFRIRELSISIQTIKNSNNFVRNLSIKIYVQNLWTKSKYSGSSPDSNFNNYIQSRGLDYFNIPQTREIGLEVKIKI